jgi:cytochrome c oxidase subunit 3
MLMNTCSQQDYLQHSNGSHALNPSPWPALMAAGLFHVVAWLAVIMHDFFPSPEYINMVIKMRLFHIMYSIFYVNDNHHVLVYENINPIFLALLLSSLVFTFWIRDVLREGTFTDHHTDLVKKSLRLGMLLFIVSEIFFFLGFFWAYFHAALAPSIVFGSVWPPVGLHIIAAYQIPLANTFILLSSGACITVGHHQHLQDKREYTIMCLIATILLALLFTRLQIFEYFNAAFDISDSVYGASFYLSTGFHGVHVIIGTIFIVVTTIRIVNSHLTVRNHFGLEAAAWYWHFVDVIWLFLFLSVYIWGNYT